MSERVIQADYEALERIAQSFADAGHGIEEMLRDVKGRLESLRGEWIGLGSDAFFSEVAHDILPACHRLTAALAEASEVTLHIRTVIQEAEAQAAGLFESDGTALPDGEGKSFFGHVGDFFSGMWAEGVDTVTGIGNAILHPVETAKGLWYGITHPGEMWNAIKEPYVEDWNNGRPWRAIGRGTLAVLTMVVGAKGIDKAAKAVRGVNAIDEIAHASTLADEAGRIGSLADDAANFNRFLDEAGYLNTSVDDVASAILQESTEGVASRSHLISELAEHGIKHTPEEIVAITRDSSGHIVFLETGTSSAMSPKSSGLMHILERHADDFANRGVPPQDIPRLLSEAIEHGKIVGYQGQGTGRPIYEVLLNGEKHTIAITIGDNGYIVGANPSRVR